MSQHRFNIPRAPPEPILMGDPPPWGFKLRMCATRLHNAYVNGDSIKFKFKNVPNCCDLASYLRGWSPALCVPSFKNLEGVLTILCALTQKRIVLNSIVLFWVSAQSIVKAPSKFLKLRFSEQVTSLQKYIFELGKSVKLPKMQFHGFFNFSIYLISRVFLPGLF